MSGELCLEATAKSKFQLEIVELLYENLFVALDMVQTVRAEQDTVHGRFRWDLVRMHTALMAIRRLQSRIEDQTKWKEINDFADEVERQWREL